MTNLSQPIATGVVSSSIVIGGRLLWNVSLETWVVAIIGKGAIVHHFLGLNVANKLNSIKRFLGVHRYRHVISPLGCGAISRFLVTVDVASRVCDIPLVVNCLGCLG